MRGYFFIGFIEFMFRNKSLGGFTNLFLPNNFGKNDKKLKNFVVKYNRLMKYGSKAPNKFIYNQIMFDNSDSTESEKQKK